MESKGGRRKQTRKIKSKQGKLPTSGHSQENVAPSRENPLVLKQPEELLVFFSSLLNSHRGFTA